MIRNLKALGLALVAMLAMSAVVASAGQAANFTAAEYPATLTGEQIASEKHVFTVAGGRKVTCEGATFSGTLTSPSSTQTITPAYSACHANILGAILPATVTFNDCDYLFHVTAGATHDWTGTADLVCPTKDVEIHVYKESATHIDANEVCHYTITGQTGLSKIEYKVTTGMPNDLDVKANVTGIAYHKTFGTLATCGAASGTSTYVGNTTVKAFNGAGGQISGDIG
jgi:hypothetical protein